MTNNWVPEETAAPAATSPRSLRPGAWRTLAILAIALLIGVYFRTLNLTGWDGTSYLHPDERFIIFTVNGLHVPRSFSDYLTSGCATYEGRLNNPRNPQDTPDQQEPTRESGCNTLNPRNYNWSRFFVYGTLPTTLTRVVVELRRTLDAEEVRNTGRMLSTLWDLGSILMVFLIGRRLYDRRVGLLAALLLAMAVLPIQLAHFFTVDSATAFFTLLTIYWCIRVAQGGGLGSFAGMGLSIGAAMACRATLATLALIAIMAVMQRVWWHQEPRTENREPRTDDVGARYIVPLPKTRRGFVSSFGMLVLAGVLALLAFRVLQPDAFVGSPSGAPFTPALAQISPRLARFDSLFHGRGFFDIRPEPRFVENLKTVQAQVSGEQDFPPAQQWANRVRYLFPLQNMILWGMGLPLGLAAWLAWTIAGWQMLRWRRLVHLLPWLWIAFYFAWQGGIQGMTMRYYMLLYGLLIIFAAWALVALWDWRPTGSGDKVTRRQGDKVTETGDTITLSPLHRVTLSGWPVLAGRLALVLVVLGTLCWAYAFTRIYTRPHSRIAATRWIYDNMPSGAARTFEAWDDPLPLNIDGRNDQEYIGVDMAPYREDDRNKYFGEIRGDGSYDPGLFDQLDMTDYIVLSSNRVYGSATRLPMRFPALTRYYHYLFSGDLGFELIADIHSYPTLFGIEINDQVAEEAFSVYDHPRVLIFKKTPAYSRAMAEDLITGDVSWGEVYKLATGKASRVPTALRLTEAEWPLYRAGGTWTALFDPASIANKVPWLVWIVVLELLSLAMFALLFRLLPGLPDRGFALAKTLGLLVVAYGAWLLGSVRLMAFTPTTVWLCAGVLIGLGALAGWTARADLRAFIRRRWAALLAAEGLFLLAFFGFVLIRAINPDLWHGARGGEKPMDLAFLTAVLKSSAFPPYDPWFAGGYINYYYFGFVFVGALIHLTGIVPTTAYNLAVPTVFALTALGAWGVAYNLVALRGPRTKPALSGGEGNREQRTKEQQPGRVRLRSEWRAITAGIVAAVFVVVVGNLAQAVWLMPGTTNPDDPVLTAEQQSDDPFPNGSYAEQQHARGRTEWAFWDATRIVGLSLRDSTINEFPFFTFLYADLHAHMIALPFAVTALGLMVALVKTKNPEPRTARRRWRSAGSRFLLLGSLALVVGALQATNTWDYPTYMGLSVLTLALLAWNEWWYGPGWLAALGDWALARIGWLRGAGLSALAGWALASLGLLLLTSLLFLPFTRHFATDYAGLELWKSSRTLASDFLKINGLWLYLLLSAALVLYHRVRGVRPLWLALIGVAIAGATIVALRLDPKILSTDPMPEDGFQGRAILLLLPLVIGAIWLVIDLLFGARPAITSREHARHPFVQPRAPEPEEPAYTQLTLPAIDEIEGLPAPVLPPAPRGPVTAARISPATLLPVIWAMCALGITLVTEIVVAKGDIGRMNTVFKFGMQSWVLFGICSALALTWLLSLLVPSTSRTTLTAYQALGWLWSIPAALLIAGALAYPLTATPARLADRFDTSIPPTLDGTAYMRSAQSSWSENNQNINFSEDANAMDWMRQNIQGTRIVLEAHAEAYRWSGRVSIYTGLPTLLGWPWHETQQRSVAEVGPILSNRQGLILNLYSGQSPVEALQQLRLHGVEYVYVGQLERALYDPAGLAKFDLLASEGNIEQVYASGATRIYRVPPADHQPAVLTTSLPVQAPVVPPTKTLLLDTPVAELPVVEEFAWNRLADSQPVAVILWLLASYALLALGLPLAGLAFGRARPGAWSDGGYTWARLIGLLLLGYAIWMPVSMRLWLYNRWGLIFGLLLVLALDAALLILRGRSLRRAGEGRLPLGRWFVNGLRALWIDLTAHWRRILLLEALFLTAFAFMTVLRMLNPDLWQPYFGGEKPFEFGMLNAILRSPVMPPYDPFYSDGILNYYYYGLFLVSLPVKATGIAPAVAFNLIIPTLFAITVVSAFALVARMTGRVRFGLAGVAFVALLGNLAAAFAVGGSPGLKPVQDALRDGNLSEFGERLGAWFWGPSRVIPNTINEFPYWSFLFADLHAHLIALPITILVAALAYEFLTSRRPDLRIEDGGWRIAARPSSILYPLSSIQAGQWLLAALALGALAVTNSWDFPTYALLIAGALLGRAWRVPAQSIGERIIGMGTAVVATGLLCAGALLLYLPFFQNYLALVQGLDRVRDRTPIISYTLIYGLFLAVLIPLLLGAAWRLLGKLPARGRAQEAGPLADDIGATPVVGIVATPPSRQRLAISPRLIMVIVLGVLAVVAIWQPRLSLDLALITGIVVGASVLLARRPSPTTWFITWMAVVAWAVSFGIEHIYIRDHLAGGDWYRMNTVFKFGMQAWVLLALAAAAGLPVLMRGLRRLSVIAEGVAWPILGALLAVALVFPLAGTPSRLATRFPETVGPTLDGLAFMDKATFTAEYLGNAPIDLRGDGEAIRWLNANITGTPVVLQSSMEFYRTYGNRVAANTGLPTIMGSQHESEQRDGGPVGLRDNEVQQIYRTLDPSEALRLLAKYRVNYLYVGPIERAAYGEPGTAKFDQMDGSYMNLVYHNPTVKIFKVNDSVYSIIGAAAPRPMPQPPAGLSQPQPIIVQPAPNAAPNPPPDQAASGDLEQQVTNNPTAAGPAFELAQRYRDMGRLDDAANILSIAAPANPGDVALHQLWGDILRDAGRLDEAEAAYRAAIAAAPKAGNYNKLGIELLNWRMLDKAEEVFQQAISVEPNEPEPYYHLGEVYEQQGKPEQAIKAYTQYLNLAPPDAPYRNQATSALSRLGR